MQLKNNKRSCGKKLSLVNQNLTSVMALGVDKKIIISNNNENNIFSFLNQNDDNNGNKGFNTNTALYIRYIDNNEWKYLGFKSSSIPLIEKKDFHLYTPQLAIVSKENAEQFKLIKNQDNNSYQFQWITYDQNGNDDKWSRYKKGFNSIRVDIERVRDNDIFNIHGNNDLKSLTQGAMLYVDHYNNKDSVRDWRPDERTKCVGFTFPLCAYSSENNTSHEISLWSNNFKLKLNNDDSYRVSFLHNSQGVDQTTNQQSHVGNFKFLQRYLRVGGLEVIKIEDTFYEALSGFHPENESGVPVTNEFSKRIQGLSPLECAKRCNLVAECGNFFYYFKNGDCLLKLQEYSETL